MIDAEKLMRLAGQHAALASVLAPELEAQLSVSSINTHLRRAHFMAQMCYESWYFSHLEENLNYSAVRIAQVWPRLAPRASELEHNPQALANAAYANRIGNGDEASGDGYQFRGRGLIQLTGRANYHAQGLDATPDVVATPHGAVSAAIKFWFSHSINSSADVDDATGVTRKINPALEGLQIRKLLTVRAKTIFI